MKDKQNQHLSWLGVQATVGQDIFMWHLEPVI